MSSFQITYCVGHFEQLQRLLRGHPQLTSQDRPESLYYQHGVQRSDGLLDHDAIDYAEAHSPYLEIWRSYV